MTKQSNRERVVIRTSVLSILSNLVLAGFKAFVGIFSNSIAIISDALNNLSDALSSIITIVGTKLAGKPADKNHPYGYGRVEYVTSLVVSAIVLYAGLTAFIESVKKIFSPETPEYDTFALVVLVVAILIKFSLGLFVKKKGREVKSDSLVASGSDAFNDALLSISVLVSAVIFLVFHISLEPYVGALVSVFVIKTGVELIKNSVNFILGTRIESSLSKAIKKEVEKDKNIQGAFDLVLHDYGPGRYLGSIHIEVPDTLSVAEIDRISRGITKRVQKKYGVLLHTIGIYSINTTDKSAIKTREQVQRIVFSHKGILEMHGFFLDEEEKTLSFDIIIDFEEKNREKIYNHIYDELKSLFKGYKINITLDVDTSD
ncbi:cation transporter [Candidatus Saccharibacteria bacterium]|nr:cation transporter [Candidatus Saccharibacteria bacterium]